MPHLTLACQCVVLDDEDPNSIWPLSLVTVNVKITRRPLLAFQAGSSRQQPQQFGGSGAGAVVDASTDLRCTDREASWYLSGGSSGTGGFDDLTMGRFTGMEREEEENDPIDVSCAFFRLII